MKQSARSYLPSEIHELGWAVAEGQTDAYPFQVRYRCFLPDFPRFDYPVRLNVFWEMEHPLQNGLASSVDISIMQAFEEKMVRALETNGTAVLTAVLTGRSEREFVFQTRSIEDFSNCLNAIPQEAQPFPIKIFSSGDSDWKYFQDLIGEN
jgi:hypothetical protein